ncbi:MAG: hypothetical protein ABSC04_18690 [Syntrophobacteraceae bacterium]|jgi:hypothetical protein
MLGSLSREAIMAQAKGGLVDRIREPGRHSISAGNLFSLYRFQELVAGLLETMWH